MPKSRWPLSAETITAIAAVVTALVALGVGVWQTAETRRHNRLSVRPHLTVDNLIRVNADRLGNPTREASIGTTLTVENEGLGVAIVTGSEIHFETAEGEVVSKRGGSPWFPGWKPTACEPSRAAL